MPRKSDITRTLGLVIIFLVAALIIINILYLITACSTRQCLITNVSTIILLLWVSAFWLVVLKYFKDKKD